MKFEPGQHIHLVGIGGSGMSAIARVLLEQGYTVSGSDRGSNELTEALARDGATIYTGHDAAYIARADMLIITSAVKDDHVEVAAARSAGIPVYKRQDVMAALMDGKKVIAVAGTKGKTTTASMIVHILRECGQDPSYIVGGILGNTGTNAGVGKGEWFVVEADEYDNMFLGLRPDIAVITNIEWDHPDFFKTPEEMVEAFEKFACLLDQSDLAAGGILIACTDDANVRRVVESLYNSRGLARGIVVPYGTVPDSPNKTLVADIHTENDQLASFNITRSHLHLYPENNKPKILQGKTVLPGNHNALNALGSYLAVQFTKSVSEEACLLASLATFKPTARRFDLRADLDGVAVIDDYAHNPMSIRATLDAARQRYPGRELWAVWQPHTYSRTQALFDDFVTSFDQADHVLITDIYAARENPIPGVNSAGLVAAMTHPDVRHTATFADTVEVLRREVKSPAVILIMSAGDAPQIGVDYLKVLEGEA